MDKTNQDYLLVLCRLFTHFLFNREIYNQILKICVDEGWWGKYHCVLECSELELHGWKKRTCTALENRDVACAAATGKIPGQRENKLNPNNACISCSSTYHNTAIPYYAMPYLKAQRGMNTRISSISKCKLGNTRSTSAFICLTCIQHK